MGQTIRDKHRVSDTDAEVGYRTAGNGDRQWSSEGGGNQWATVKMEPDMERQDRRRRVEPEPRRKDWKSATA
jgi:hypothetical protein